MKLLKIIFFMLLLWFSNYVLALDAPKNVFLDKSSDNSLEISWDKVTWAEIYAVSYWKEPISNWSYENELEIVVNEDWKATIENLESNTKYYIWVKSFDSSDGESEYSSEVSFLTVWDLSLDSWELKISNIDLYSAKDLEISFNVNLKNDISLVSVNIVNLNESLEDIEVDNYEINSNVLKVELINPLIKSENYSITIVSLEWENWEKIKSWVDWVINFELPDVFKQKENLIDSEESVDLNSAWESNTINDTGSSSDSQWMIESNLNSVSESNQTNDSDSENNLSDQSTWSTNIMSDTNVEIDETNDTENKVLWGDTIVDPEVKAVESIAKEKDSLPTTWPTETILFLLLSLIVWALIIMSRKKSVS